MNNNLIFSVVIPTYHRNDLLAKCLDCLAPSVQSLSVDQYEVIVTDDGSQTTAEELIQQYSWAHWVSGPHKGPAANRNNGARYAHGEWLVFTDDDCLPDTHWLEAYLNAIVASSATCFVFEGRTYVDRPQRSLAEKSPVNETGGYLWSCNLMIQKNLFFSLNGFDERFPYAAMEDVDFRLRLTQAGHKSLFSKESSVCHPWRVSRGWKELKRHQESTFIYLSIHPEEKLKINSIYYLRCTLRSFLKFTIPSLLRPKERGTKHAFIEHFAFLQMAFLLLFNRKPLHFNSSVIRNEKN
jgi:GT2 family glycosyltransferase